MGKLITVPISRWRHKDSREVSPEDVIKDLRSLKDSKLITKKQYDQSIEALCKRYGLVNIYKKA